MMDERYVWPTRMAAQNIFVANRSCGNINRDCARSKVVDSGCRLMNVDLPVGTGNQLEDCVMTESEMTRMVDRSMNWFTRAVSGNGMKSIFLTILLVCLIALSLPSQAQPAQTTAAISGQVVTPFGGPAASALVRICQITSAGIPCSTSGVSLFSDYMLSHALPNPVVTDQYGNYKVFLVAGLYSVQVSLSGAAQPTYIYYAAASASATGGGGGGNPAGVFTDVQLHGATPVFAADSGNLQNNSTTHNLRQKLIDFIPYAGQFCSPTGCATPNGIVNAIGSTQNQSIIVATDDNNDPTQFSIINGTQINRFTTDGFAGTWMTNPAYGTITAYFDPFAGANSKIFGLIDTIPDAGRGGTQHSVLELADACYGLGWNVANPFGVTSGTGWSGCANLNISSLQFREGLDGTLIIGVDNRASGDLNVFREYVNYVADSTAASTEGVTLRAMNVVQHNIASGVITATTNTGDLHPVFTNINFDGVISVGAEMLDFTAPSVAFTINNSSNLVRQSVMDVAINSSGSGQTDGFYTINATGGGGTGAQAGIGIGGGQCGSHFIINPGVNYTSPPTFVVSAGGTPCIVTGVMTTYVRVMNTSGGSLTPDTGDGVTNAEIVASTVNGVPQSQTVTVSLQNHLAFKCSDAAFHATCPDQRAFIYIVSNAMQEKVPITSANAPSGDVQSISFLSQYPHPFLSSIFQNGTNGCFSSDLDTAPPSSGGITWFQCYSAFGALDAHNLLYGFELGGSLVDVPIRNLEPFSFSATNGANAAHVYQAARVAQYDINQQYSLVPNDVPWANGHTVVATQVPSLNFHGDNLFISSRSPTNGNLSTGIGIITGGPMVTGGFLPFQIFNGNPSSMYLESFNSLAWATASDTIKLGGPWANDISVDTIPFESIIKVGALNTSPDFNIVTTGTPAGSFFASPLNGRMGFTQSLFVGSDVVVGGGIQAATVGTFGGIVSTPEAKTPILQIPASVFTNGTINTIAINPGGTDTFESFIACNTSACAPAGLSNASLSAGALTTGDVFVGARPTNISDIFTQGTPGSTTYCYFVTQNTSIGESTRGTNVCISTGNAVLGGGNQIFLKANSTEGGQSVNIYRASTVGPYTQGLICANMTFNLPFPACFDTGQAPSAGLPPSAGKSGVLALDGYLLGTAATAPSGACSPNGAWILSQDQQITTCVAGTWTAFGGTSGVSQLLAGTNITLSPVGGTGIVTVTASATAATAFSALTSSTNTTAAMVVGSGASLGFSGTGTIGATSIGGITVSGTPSTGQVLTATSTSAANWQTVTGTGTVTHSTGALTASDCVIGNGSADIKIDPNCSLDGSGNLLTASVRTSGATQGLNLLGVGTGTITLPPGAPTAYAGWIGPASGTPAYVLQMPIALPAGQVMSCATPSTVNGLNQSVCTWTSPGGSTAFSSITSGTNTTAAMLVGTGASLGPTGTGTITATNSASVFSVNPVSAGVNGLITFGANFGVDALNLYDSGTGNVYGWGLNAGEMQFFVQDASSTHFSFNAATGGLQSSGVNEYARLTPRNSGGGWTIAGGEGYCISNATNTVTTPDTCAWRGAAGVWTFGNATTSDTGAFLKYAGMQSGGTKFTTSGCSVSSTTGGATAGIFTLGANSCTVVITMNGATGLTATNGWSCQAHDRTTPADLIAGESSSTATTASITIPVTAGATDVISFSCVAF